MKKLGLGLGLGFLLIFLNINLVFASTDHLVISQVQITGGPGKTTNDFVEIYNPTNAGVDLKGLRLVKRTKTAATDTLLKSWTDSSLVKAHGFYLWANSDFADILVAPDVKTTGTISDDNGVALRLGSNDTGIIIDSLAWGQATNAFIEGSAFPNNPGINQSAERKPGAGAGNGTDTNNNAADFFLQTNTHPRNSQSAIEPPITSDPGGNPPADQNPPPADQNPPTNPPPAPADESPSSEPVYSSNIIISEIFPNPDGTDSGEEWIELYNNSNADIDLKGWKVDDFSKDDTIGSSAFFFEQSAIIKAMDFYAVDLPEKSFALNNTGGDTVRLFWPNDKLSTSTSYLGSAKEDESYAKKSDNTFAWTSLVTKGYVNTFNLSNQQNENLPNVTTGNTKVEFIELMPNPVGADSGAEWITIKNFGSEAITLHNWIFDDGKIGDEIGSNAWVVQSPTIEPGQTSTLIIPAGKFAMNNAGLETVRVFAPNKILIDSIAYSDAKEGMVYKKGADGKWKWENLANLKNPADQTNEKILINEVFPEPESGTEEFIELFNAGEIDLNLANWKVSDLASDYKIASGIIKPGGYFVLLKAVSKIALNNSGAEKVSLTNPNGKIVAELEYEDAPKNQSFNLTEKGDYAWSGQITPGDKNIIGQLASASVTLGKVKGAKTLPRTGADSNNFEFWSFVIFVLLWYIYGRLNQDNYEQTRAD